MHRNALCLFVWLSVPSWAAAASPPPKAASWRPVDYWRQPQGLPQNTVMVIRQTRDGYLWLGTKGGVTRFDGLRFTTFDDARQDQLRENEVHALTEGPDGAVWIGTYGGGVSRLKDGAFSVFTTRDGLVNDYVSDLCTDGSGAVWMATDGGVSRYGGGRFTSYTVADGLPHTANRSLLCERDGSVLVGTSNGKLSRFANGHIEVLDVGLTPGAEVKSLCRDHAHALWIATTDGVLRVKDGHSTRFTSEQGLPSNWTLAVIEDPRGTIWVGGERGVAHFSEAESAFRTLGPEVTTIQTVKSLYADGEGNVWVGGLIDGMVRMRETLFTTYNTDDGLADPYVTAVLEDSRHTVWLGTAKGLGRLDATGVATYTVGEPKASSRITAIAEDKAGDIWVGTNEGLYRLQAGKLVPVKNDSLPLMNIRILHADRQGALWLGTQYEGLLRYQDGRFTRYTMQEGLSHDAVRSMAEDPDGSLWIGTKGGLTHLKDGTFTRYTERDGLANISVESLYMDKKGMLWIATRQGVNRLSKGRFATFTAGDGLLASFVYCFVEDDEGHFWMNSSKGIFRVRRRELDDFADGKVSRLSSVAYGVEHGLSSTVGVISQFPVAYKGYDGRVWFCTLRGVCVVDPSNLASNGVPPPVHVEQVLVDDRLLNGVSSVSAPPGRGNLSVRYTGLSWMAPEKTRFKYKLEGYDRDWVDAGDRRVAYYTNIPPGHYQFLVHASNNDRVWNTTGAAVDVYLSPHVYQTLWFRSLCLLGIGLAVLSAHSWRLRALRNRERELSSGIQEALAQVKMLRGLLPICASCKKVRDDRGYWNQIETFIHERSEAEFSHSICPDCMHRLYPEYDVDGSIRS
jgi:ligand-binding sensor domain-containing protein